MPSRVILRFCFFRSSKYIKVTVLLSSLMIRFSVMATHRTYLPRYSKSLEVPKNEDESYPPWEVRHCERLSNAVYSSLLTPGASPVAAGVINILNLAAMIVAVQMSSHRCRSTGGDICKRSPVSGQHTISISFKIPRSKTTHDPGNFVHDRTR
jgi:hypothetical protein